MAPYFADSQVQGNHLSIQSHVDLTLVQTFMEVLATVAFALSGLLEAARKKLDAVGVVVVAGMAAFGGGTLRDILLDRRPFFWMQHASWLWALLALCILSMFFLRTRHFEVTERGMLWPDAIGLGLFSASGTQISLGMDMPAIVAVLMGVITAVFGGVLRDIVCNEIPSAFRDHRPYAICAFVGSWILVAAPALQLSDSMAMIVSAVTVTVLRVLALATGFQLPAWDSGGTTQSKPPP
jgi:uncharacterized membrane protein YeiH